MEFIAIALLVMILLLGGVTLFIFFQFLSTVRENRKLYSQIMDEIKAVKREIKSRPRSPEDESQPDPDDADQ